ncbi:MAG: PAS domain-containing protein [Syntrophales bacterium]|jgi:PAS domain S-box-containing protein/putative nucleotidyltransferase with HDIG domain|nr:PAS domain-containing protein [Syntrophales bacterium]
MSKPLRILIVEDSEDDALLTIRELKKGGYEPEYERVETAGAMRTALREKSWDIILCDYNMPKFNGLAAIALLKETGIDIPLIIISGAIGEETAAECMRLGARDFFIKGKLPRLASAIERELREAESSYQRKQADKALKESEELYRTFINATSDMVYLKDEQFHHLVVNKRLAAFFGKPEGEIIGKSDFELMPHIAAERCRQTDLESISNQSVLISEEIVGDQWYETLKFPVKLGRNRFGMGGFIRDITDRKRAEEKLLQQKNLFNTIIESTSEAIFAKDKTGKYQSINEAGARMLGYRAADVIGHTDMELLPAETAGEFRRTDEYVMSSGQVYEREEIGIIRDKKCIFLSHKSPWLDNSGKIIGVIGVSNDITARKQAEQKLKDTLESLRIAVGATVQVLVSAVEIRDPYTAGHQIRSADLARAIAAELGLSQNRIDGIRMAGTIHDIGKMSVPSEILSKPTKLTELEFSLIKEHANKGFEMLKDVESPWPLAEIVHQHHERMDGSGYPRGLKGEEIIMEARIMAVADIVESMASHRPYRPALGLDAALAEIENNKGTLYDADAVDACLRLFNEKDYKLE